MRLRLALLFVALFVTPAASEEEGEEAQPTTVIGRTSLYKDDDRTTAITAVTEVSGTTGNLALNAGVAADVVSSASVDVISNATPGQPRSYSEPRLELTAGLAYRFNRLTMSFGSIISLEHDYRSHTISLGSSVELFERNSTLAIGYSRGANTIWRALPHKGGPDPFFAARDKTRHAFDVSWSQVLDPKTVGILSYSLAIETGYLSSPYRFVSTSDGAFRTRELHPDLRLRHAVGARLRRYVFKDAAVEGMYRLYGDDWGLVSHTVGATFVWQPKAWLELELHDRVYWQSNADFYQASYATPSELMSGDKELSKLWDNMIGVRAGVVFRTCLGPLNRMRIDVKLDWLHFEYSNFPLRPELDAYVTQLGVTGEF